MRHLDVATLNLRNIADRWPERLPLLLSDMAALQPDLMGLQECVFAVGQDRLLGAAGEARYEIHRGWAGRPEYGNSVLVKAGPGGGGSPDGARLVVRALTPVDQFADYARKIAGITEAIPEPEKKKK